MNHMNTWYLEESFWRTIYPFMFDARCHARTPKEVDDLIKLLDLQPDDTILDLGCGDARHMLELARRGYSHITGLDSTQYYLDMAKQQAETEHLPIQFIHGDMHSPSGEEACSVILSLFSSLGYFEQPEENLRVLKNAYQSLTSGGKLLADVSSKESFAYHFDVESWSERDGTYLLTKWIPLNNFSVIENHWTIIKDGHAQEFRLLKNPLAKHIRKNRMDMRLLRRQGERRIGQGDAYLNERRVNNPYQAKKLAKAASAGYGRRPQPRFFEQALEILSRGYHQRLTVHPPEPPQAKTPHAMPVFALGE